MKSFIILFVILLCLVNIKLLKIIHLELLNRSYLFVKVLYAYPQGIGGQMGGGFGGGFESPFGRFGVGIGGNLGGGIGSGGNGNMPTGGTVQETERITYQQYGKQYY